MFDKILIANRGEIACRIIQTAKKMGIETVAIYSSADINSLHVQMADSAHWVGEAPSIDSYLNQKAIIAAAITHGAEAIHPGYGFLSENPDFAEACHHAGIIFIGPPVDSLITMGSKQLAKIKLEHSKVPLIPGYHGIEQSDDHLLQEACKIGFPVLLKAANGGGGKGMRAVYKEAEFIDALTSTRREAVAYFGDANIIIEKLFLEPRHIEIQIMADNFGEVVHLFERDCSIQRRHQKIIEEAPASHVKDNIRKQMAEAAINAAVNIGYRGAGTVEFLLTDEDHFYFMEMNTRLQVEHPVTEMITGLDLVALQIAIAKGHPLPISQKDIKAEGHAIECRIYAEDPAHDFIPSIGQIDRYQEPAGIGVRVDSGVVKHGFVNQYYDPMLAKLICHGNTRDVALARLKSALKNFTIGGITSNIPFLQAITASKAFKDFNYNTHFLETNTIELAKPNTHLALLSAICYDYLHLQIEKALDPILVSSFAWQMHLDSSWCKTYLIQDKKVRVTIRPVAAHRLFVNYDNQEFTLETRLEGEKIVLTTEGTRHAFLFDKDAARDGVRIYLPEGNLFVTSLDPTRSLQKVESNAHGLTAPMPATIVALLKKVGDTIKKDDALMILEAMKMEHTVRAPRDGILAEYFYTIGDQVQEGSALLRLDIP